VAARSVGRCPLGSRAIGAAPQTTAAKPRGGHEARMRLPHSPLGATPTPSDPGRSLLTRFFLCLLFTTFPTSLVLPYTKHSYLQLIPSAPHQPHHQLNAPDRHPNLTLSLKTSLLQSYNCNQLAHHELLSLCSIASRIFRLTHCLVTNMLNKLHGQPDSYDRKFVLPYPAHFNLY
jgi:hypothetical protein